MSRLNETNIQNQLNLEDERVQRGSGIAVDVLQAKSRLQLAKERRVNFEGALENAVSTYIQVFDHAPEISEMLDPIPPLEILPASLEEALETALKNNPALTSTSAIAQPKLAKGAVKGAPTIRCSPNSSRRSIWSPIGRMRKTRLR